MSETLQKSMSISALVIEMVKNTLSKSKKNVGRLMRREIF